MRRPAGPATDSSATDDPTNGKCNHRIDGRRTPFAGTLLPAGVFYAAFFAVPMLCLLVISFWTAKGFTLVPGFTLANYEKIFTSPLYQALMLRTIGVALRHHAGHRADRFRACLLHALASSSGEGS